MPESSKSALLAAIDASIPPFSPEDVSVKALHEGILPSMLEAGLTSRVHMRPSQQLLEEWLITFRVLRTERTRMQATSRLAAGMGVLFVVSRLLPISSPEAATIRTAVSIGSAAGAVAMLIWYGVRYGKSKLDQAEAKLNTWYQKVQLGR